MCLPSRPISGTRSVVLRCSAIKTRKSSRSGSICLSMWYDALMGRFVLAMVMIWSLLLSQGWQAESMIAAAECCKIVVEPGYCNLDESENSYGRAGANALSCCASALETTSSPTSSNHDGRDSPDCPASGEECPCLCCQRVPATSNASTVALTVALEIPNQSSIGEERAAPLSRSLRPPSPPPKVS